MSRLQPSLTTRLLLISFLLVRLVLVVRLRIRTIDGSDIPVATSSAKGGVIVNGEGLRMDSNTIEVDNDVTASSTHHVVTYNAKGLITGGRAITAS